MARKLLIILLVISLLIEGALTIGCLFARDAMLQQFKLGASVDTYFLAYIVGWFCLLASLLVVLLLWRVIKRTGNYATLGYLMGFWWVGIGISIYISFGRPDNLLVDSLKGLLLVILVNRTVAGEKRTVYK